MFDDISGGSQNNEAQNAPSLSFTATPILGNTQFSIQKPIMKGQKVAAGFPTFPYLSVESLLFFQGMISTSVSPFDVLPGMSSGESTTGGQITQMDSTGTTRLVQGYQSST